MGGSGEISSSNIVRHTRLNPQLGKPISLLELWDGSLSLKQEQYLLLHQDDLTALEEAYETKAINPQQDYHCECDRFRLEYQAKDKQFLLQGQRTQIIFERCSHTTLKHLIDALKHHQTAPPTSISHKGHI